MQRACAMLRATWNKQAQRLWINNRCLWINKGWRVIHSVSLWQMYSKPRNSSLESTPSCPEVIIIKMMHITEPHRTPGPPNWKQRHPVYSVSVYIVAYFHSNIILSQRLNCWPTQHSWVNPAPQVLRRRKQMTKGTNCMNSFNSWNSFSIYGN